MSAAAFDPEWGDDVMAIAHAVGVTVRPHPELAARFVPHPSHAAEFTNLALELTVAAWKPEVLADLPIALVPTDHTECSACGDDLCGCEAACDLPRDVCSHYGQPYCYSCAPHNCPDCRGDKARWDQ